MLVRCWAADSHWDLVKWFECRTNIKYVPERCISMDRFSTGDIWNPFPLLCLKAKISVAHVGIHDKKKKNEGMWWGRRADHIGVGNKLQPAVNPQCSCECAEDWSDVCGYWKYLIIDASQGTLSHLAWSGTLALIHWLTPAGLNQQHKWVWNVYRDRKMQKEHSRKPDPCRPLLMSTAWGGHEWSWGRKKRAGLFLEPCKHQGNRRMQKRKTVDDNCWWESHVHAKNCVAPLWPGSAVMDWKLVLFMGFVQKLGLELSCIFIEF